MCNKDIKKVVMDIIAKHTEEKVSVISILQDVQEEFKYLPRESFDVISNELKISLAKLYGVATFYDNFSLEPKGKYIIKICNGTACHVRKSVPIIEAVKKAVGLEEGKETTDDMLFTVETVSCLGACGLAPVLTVNDVVYPAMTIAKTEELIDKLKSEVIDTDDILKEDAI